MKVNLKEITQISCFAFIALSSSLQGVCHRCEAVREENRSHPQTNQYYEDYLRDHPNQNRNANSTEIQRQNEGRIHNDANSRHVPQPSTQQEIKKEHFQSTERHEVAPQSRNNGDYAAPKEARSLNNNRSATNPRIRENGRNNNSETNNNWNNNPENSNNGGEGNINTSKNRQ